MKLINEPTAAAIAYQHKTASRTNNGIPRNVLIFDLGGGTFDVAILTILGGKIEVKAVRGDMHLGGEDFDQELVKYCIEYIRGNEYVDITQGHNSPDSGKKLRAACNLSRLRLECERVKCLLSGENSLSATAEIEGMDVGKDKAIHVQVPLTRSKFDALNDAKFKRCLTIVANALADAGMSKTDIDDVILVGGSTKIPKVRQLLSEYFDQKALSADVDPEQAVAYGAAIQAALLSGQSSTGDLTIRDVSPLPIGIQVIHDRFSEIIPRNHPLPCSITKYNYGTVTDNQTHGDIVIYEGENKEKASRNHLLGKFRLDEIPAAKAGDEPIDVTMTVTDEGILHVTAVCRSNQRSKDIKISEHKGRMTKAEILKSKVAVEQDVHPIPSAPPFSHLIRT